MPATHTHVYHFKQHEHTVQRRINKCETLFNTNVRSLVLCGQSSLDSSA